MLQINKVSKAYGERVLFKDVSFTVNRGEKCALVGRNGSGKTTIFRLIAKQEELDSGNISAPKGYTFGYLDQHIHFSKDSIIKEACLSLPLDERNDIYKAEAILFGLGFNKEDMDKDPSLFSGGFQLRLHLAKVLLSKPSCLLLDEPTNYLDIISINWFCRFLKNWDGECLIISHDRDFLDKVCTHTIGIHRNQIFKIQGSTEKFFDIILEQEEIYERTRANIEKKRSHMESFITRFSAKATKAAQAQSKRKALEKIPTLEKLLEIQSLSFNFNEAPFPGKKMLSTENVVFSYEEDKHLIEHLSLTIEKQERIAIIGKNGRGKSTILKLLAKELSPLKGVIQFSENLRIGYFGQTNINRLNPKLTVEEEISQANSLLTLGEVRGICGAMMFSQDDAEKKIQVLSGGEKSRVLLGKILASPCNLLLLDEPTNHLDIESIEALLDALESFSGSVVIVTHSELILRRLSLSKLVICGQNKQSLFLGDYDTFLEKQGWPEDAINASIDKKEAEYREQKKREMELIAIKNNTIRSLKKEISNIENNIIILEKKLSEENSELVRASEKGDAPKIKDLSQSIAKKDLEIENWFQKLEKLSNDLSKLL